jgi:hypothetical protein
MARPPDGLKHVDRLPGTESSKRRLRVILETLIDRRSIESACEELGIGAARLHQLRHQLLVGALDGITARPAGRPRKQAPVEPGRMEALERENARLRLELHTAEIREEIAVLMPHLVRREKKRAVRPRGKKRKRPRQTP